MPSDAAARLSWLSGLWLRNEHQETGASSVQTPLIALPTMSAAASASSKDRQFIAVIGDEVSLA